MDPQVATDIRIERFVGSGDRSLEPDWEPIGWQADEFGSEFSHQWIGTQYSKSSIPYLPR